MDKIRFIFLKIGWKKVARLHYFTKNTTATDGLGYVYMAGSSINSNGNHDIIIQKFTPDGGLVWEQTYNGAADMDDFAADLFVDDDNNVFVTGTAIDDVSDLTNGLYLCNFVTGDKKITRKFIKQ
ncbi:T9SS type A sorting domain-containing protein [Brumimicrobium aurantiacum]|uniref:T9SS C-terminal target domain-containing protein n=1 Tax=Brumimicrobium aurantiacum TaxID=1737063 RepID=A0A3E1EY02_9FLAO|nr:T9SS type A sorting domain-containing protein [Brumimicrobium aurantiacum]RFC54418.1 T9SS C-terminal target domain-containing protein [Brumimicrobium aurantiacum]